MKAILATKVGMTEIFNNEGVVFRNCSSGWTVCSNTG